MDKSLVPDLPGNNDKYIENTDMFQHFLHCPKCRSTKHLIMENICVDTVNGSVVCYPDEIEESEIPFCNYLLNPDEMVLSVSFLCHKCGMRSEYTLKAEDRHIRVDLCSLPQDAMDI